MVRFLALVVAAGVLCSAAAASPVRSETASIGAVRATVSYVRLRKPGIYYVRLVVVRDGGRVFDRRVLPFSRQEPWNQPIGVWRSYGEPNARTITLRDLNADGEPEIVLDFWLGGAHCCYWTRIYRWDPAARSYTNTLHGWGNFAYRLADITGSGRSEFVTADNRFAYAFASFAGSGAPVEVWEYRSARFVNTTRSYPALISADAASWWKLYGQARRTSWEVRGLLAAWAADESLLGHGAAALAWLSRHRFVLSGRDDEQSGSVASYLKHLSVFLRRTDYLR